MFYEFDDDPLGMIKKAMEDVAVMDAIIESLLPGVMEYLETTKRDDTGVCPYCGNASECFLHGTCKDCHMILFDEILQTPEDAARFIGANILLALVEKELPTIAQSVAYLMDTQAFLDSIREVAQEMREAIERDEVVEVPEGFSGFFN